MPTFSTADSSAADQTTPTADGTVKVTLETPLPTSGPTRASQSPRSPSAPYINKASTEDGKEAEGEKEKKKYKNAAFSGVESRCRLRPKTADFDVSGSAEAGREGSSRAITRRITVCLPPTTTTVTAVFSPSVAESRSSARVDGSQLHMRRDPARSPIDRQRIASLQFPGFGARLARFVTSVSL